MSWRLLLAALVTTVLLLCSCGSSSTPIADLANNPSKCHYGQMTLRGYAVLRDSNQYPGQDFVLAWIKDSTSASATDSVLARYHGNASNFPPSTKMVTAHGVWISEGGAHFIEVHDFGNGSERDSCVQTL